MNDAQGNPIGAMNIEDLGLQYNNNVLFFLDGCHSGECGGDSPNWAPIVPDGQYNDMAEMLGCYYFGAGPKVYLGWFGDSYNSEDYNSFIGHQGVPMGMYDMWTGPGTGRVLSYVIGNYPNQLTCPRMMYSSNNPPASWNAVYRNLRIFGAGSFGDNMGMNERDFNIIP
jgi:hypothetical protein